MFFYPAVWMAHKQIATQEKKVMNAPVVRCSAATADTSSNEPPPASVTQPISSRTVSRPVSQRTEPPDFDEVLLVLDEAKHAVPLAEGLGALEDAITNPLGVLCALFPRCKPEKLEALMMRAVNSGHLIALGKNVFRMTLAPESAGPASRRSSGQAGQASEDAELAQLQAAERRVAEELERERARLDEARRLTLSALEREHERAVSHEADEIRRQAERALTQRRREIEAARDQQLAELRQKYEAAVQACQDGAERQIEAATRELETAAEKQIERAARNGQTIRDVEMARRAAELEERDRVTLLPLNAKLAGLQKRGALIRQLREERRKPIA